MYEGINPNPLVHHVIILELQEFNHSNVSFHLFVLFVFVFVFILNCSNLSYSQ